MEGVKRRGGRRGGERVRRGRSKGTKVVCLERRRRK